MNVKSTIIKNLNFFKGMSKNEIYEHRKNKFLKIGRGKGFVKSSTKFDQELTYKEPIFNKFKRNYDSNKLIYIGVGLAIFVTVFAILY